MKITVSQLKRIIKEEVQRLTEVMPGETVGLGGANCSCGEHLELEVCRSAAGFYLGYFCPNCGPYSRESGYFKKREDAEALLDLV